MVYNEMEYTKNEISYSQLSFQIYIECKISSWLKLIQRHNSFEDPPYPSYNRRQQTRLRILPDWSPISCTRSKIWKFQLFIFSISESCSVIIVSNLGLCTTCIRVRDLITSKIIMKTNLPIISTKKPHENHKSLLNLLNGAISVAMRK